MFCEQAEVGSAKTRKRSDGIEDLEVWSTHVSPSLRNLRPLTDFSLVDGSARVPDSRSGGSA